jgi:8-oxo-dGTP pyrophosphatase MutT (NUDIX family)
VGDDPGVAELLDVYAPDGTTHLGVKERAAVHRDGDWHLAFHLWVVCDAGVLLQRRATTKAAWPGRLDATAAGHLVAGERIEDGLREAEEELGVRFAFGDLAALGVHRVDEHGPVQVNREHQHVFAVRDARPLDAWHAFDRTELDGLVLVGHAEFARLVAADGPVAGRAWDGEAVRVVELGPDELVPTPYLAALVPRLAEL